MSTVRRVDKPTQVASISSEILDRQPPCSVEAEHCVLGSILLLPDCCDDVAMKLRPGDFYDEANQKLYTHMLGMHDAGRKIDLALLVEQLKSSGDYESIGGAAYLARIGNAVPNAAHSGYYATIVQRKATYRRLIQASTEILRDAYGEVGEARELLNTAEQKIFAILEQGGEGEAQPIEKIMQEAMDRLDARMRGEHTTGGVDTGFADLDALLNGLHNSQLIILAARPGMGKTALGMNIVENVVLKYQVPALFVSLEMSTIELADRLLCSIAEVNSHRLRNGTLSQEDRRRLVEKMSLVSEAPLYVDDTPSRNVMEIASAARRIKRQTGRLGLIVVDYLQLVQPDNSKDPRQEQVAKIARRLKLLARDIDVPVLCLAQLNRQAEEGRGTRPKLSHLRESGAIEQDADVVMFIHRPELEAESQEERSEHAGEAELIVAKHRNGPVGDIQLTWRKEFTRFGDSAHRHREEFEQFNQTGGF